MATEEFKSLKKELYTDYMEFMEFKNSKEENKGKGSSVKPENISLSFQQYFDNYITWIKSTEEAYAALDSYDQEEYKEEASIPKEYDELSDDEITKLKDEEESY